MPKLCDELSRFVTQPPQFIHGETSPDEIQGKFMLTHDFAGFQGHFPNNPLLPGIVQIMLARYTAAMGKNTPLLKVKRCKFSHLIKPGGTIIVNVRQGKNTGDYLATLTHEERVCTVLAFQLADEAV